jgi:hypothetical protein
LPEGSLVKYREWYGSNGKPNEGVRLDVGLVCQGIIARELVPSVDEPGKFEKEIVGYGTADPSIFVRDGGPSIAETHLAGGLTWRRADNKRIPGWAEVRRRLNGVGGRPLLYFLDCCDDSIRTIPTLQIDQTKIEDLDTEGEDHCADELRYACMSRPWIEETPFDEVEHLPKLPGEMTIMDHIEAQRQRRLLQEQDLRIG